MKLLIRLVLPITIISFAIITKWWYALPVDAPDTLYAGFPFPFIGEGWHTSGSFQLFVLEFLADFATYFLFWFLLFYGSNRFYKKIVAGKLITNILWVLAGLIMCGAGIIARMSDNIYHLKRPYDMEIMETGYKFIWEQTERPDYYKYFPDKKQK